MNRAEAKLIEQDPEDLSVEVSTAYGHFAMVPEALVNSGVSDAAVRMYAVLALHANRKTNSTFVGYRAAELMSSCRSAHVSPPRMFTSGR
jgi:hypothetical protein